MARRKPTHPPTLEDDLLAIGKQVQKRRDTRRRLSRAPSHHRIGLLIAWGLLLGVLLLIIGNGETKAHEEPVIRIDALVPQAQVWDHRTQLWATAQLRQEIESGDAVRTDRAGQVQLHFPDDTIVKLGPNTVFRVVYSGYIMSSGAKVRRFQLLQGRMWARVSKFWSGNSSFNVQTPTAVAGVRGTRFSVLVYQDSGVQSLPDGTTLVSVNDGVVEVAALASPQRTRLLAGQQTMVFPNVAMAPPPQAMTPAELQSWQNQRNDLSGDVLADPTSWAIARLLTQIQEQLIRPVAAGARLAHLDTLSGGADPRFSEDAAQATTNGLGGEILAGAEQQDIATLARAMTAARALQLALSEVDDPTEGYPADIGLSDLSALSLSKEKRTNILDNIDGGRVVSYKKTTHGYELTVRAKKPSGVLIKVTPEEVVQVQDAALNPGG